MTLEVAVEGPLRDPEATGEIATTRDGSITGRV